jgi:hypothetical protein
LETPGLPLIASLAKVTSDSLLTVTFSAPVYVISNLTSLDERVFEIKVRPGRDSRVEDIAIKGWTVLSKKCMNANSFLILEMTSTTIVIQLRYLYPEKISQQNVRDELELRFLMPEFILQEKTG